MATVVVVLSPMPARSSTRAPACVIRSSVRSGRISDNVPMKVVLPTANGPTTRSLTAACTVSRRYMSSDESTESIEHLLQEMGLGDRSRAGRNAGDDMAAVGEIGQQDLGHARRQPQVPADLGDRQGAAAAELDDPALFRGQAAQLVAGDDH